MWQRGQKNNCRPLNSENESCGTKVLAYTVRMRHTDRISHVQGVDVTDPIGVSHATCFSLSILLIHLSYEKYFSGPSAMWTRECGANLLWSDDTVNFYFGEILAMFRRVSFLPRLCMYEYYVYDNDYESLIHCIRVIIMNLVI